MTIEKLPMPQLGESVTEGTLERWLVQIGDIVEKYEPIAEVMTDKVGAEIPSSFTGKIIDLLVPEGTTVAVGTTICTIETVEIAEIAETEAVPPQQVEDSSQQMSEGEPKERYSPVVSRLLIEQQIDPSAIQGTGLNGRLTRKDVLMYIEGGNESDLVAIVTNDSEEQLNIDEEIVQEQPTVASFDQQEEQLSTMPVEHTRPEMPEQDLPIIEKAVPQTKKLLDRSTDEQRIPVTSLRRKIAENMVRSKHEIPHAWMMIEVDATELVTYRQSIKDEFEQREGFPITYFAFFVKMIAQALKEYPMMNATWDGDHIIVHKNVNISIAVAGENELFVPVIKQADEKSIKGIARDIYELSQLARQKKLTMAHVEGGTFTVNNTGTFGSIASAGIINYPQAAIVQVEKISKKYVVTGESSFAIRDIVNICLSLDHRILDGLICGNFLNKVKYLVENTDYRMMSVY